MNGDGSAAVGLAFKDCTRVYAFKWTANSAIQRDTSSVGSAAGAAWTAASREEVDHP